MTFDFLDTSGRVSTAFDDLNRKFDIELINKLKLELQAKVNNLIALSNTQIDNLSIASPIDTSTFII